MAAVAFYMRRPPWCEAWPDLAAAVLALDDAMLEGFVAGPGGLPGLARAAPAGGGTAG